MRKAPLNWKELGIDQVDLENVDILVDLLSENEREVGKGPFTDLKGKSTRMPPPDEYNNLDVFLRIVSEELERIPSKHYNANSNLSKQEIEAL